MKKSILTTAIIAILMVDTTSYGQQNDIVKSRENSNKDLADARKPIDNPNEYLSEYHQFKIESEKKIVKNEKKIAELKSKYVKVNEKEDAAFNKEINALVKKNRDLKKKLANYKNDNDMLKWESFKKDFKQTMDDLGTELKDFSSKIKNQCYLSKIKIN